jgi:hypothetical protein
MTFWIFVLLLLTCALAFAPPAARRSRTRLLVAFTLTCCGVVVPVLVFLLSAFLAPISKTEGIALAAPRWLASFHLGKLAVTPIVLWAAAALYAVEVRRVEDRARPWIVTGLFLGAVVAALCLWLGWATVAHNEVIAWGLLVPLYVTVWYGVRAVRLGTMAKLPLITYLRALAISVPFWLLGIFWARRHYESLPESSGCFIVTAASRGHEPLVGPFVEVTHGGVIRRVNQQLRTLWQFEALWQSRAPRSHAGFRLFYDRIGPLVARRIRSPWLADLVYVGLKPLELIAALTIRLAGLLRDKINQQHP